MIGFCVFSLLYDFRIIYRNGCKIKYWGSKMTFEEALELFGLRRIPSEAVLKVLRNDAVKEAIEAKDEDRQKDIHRAFAVLTGKEDAELDIGQDGSSTGPTGFVKAVCSEYKDRPFVLEWIKARKSPLVSTDVVMLQNPQKLEWDTQVDGYVRIDSAGKRFNYDDKDYSAASASPFDQHGDHWKSDFEAEIEFDIFADCPCCNAPALQWCQHCDTIFCHKLKDDYPDQKYACPNCEASYGWGEGFTGGPVKKVFDGKHLRSLTAEERKSLTNTKLLK